VLFRLFFFDAAVFRLLLPDEDPAVRALRFAAAFLAGVRAGLIAAGLFFLRSAGFNLRADFQRRSRS